MLRSITAAHRLLLHPRALSTVAPTATATVDSSLSAAEQPSSPAAAPAPTPDETTGHHQEGRTPNPTCMFVYPWHGMRSSAEGLAIARAVQDKCGRAKEVVFPRDPDSVNLFQPYFWLVYDDPAVRERLLDTSERISFRVPDLPRGDGNVGIEHMMRGLGLSTTEDDDAPRALAPDTETEAPKDAGDPPKGYKNVDVRVGLAYSRGPGEVFQRRRSRSASLPKGDDLPAFATTWLAFDGFSPESARGSHTPNLLRARTKWRDFAPQNALGNPPTDAAAMSPTEALAEPGTGTESAASKTRAQAEEARPSLEWTPILPSIRLTQRPGSAASPVPKSDTPVVAAAPDDLNSDLFTAITADAADPDPDVATPTTKPTGMECTRASVGSTMSRRDRILHLARQNARTPLPEPTGEPPLLPPPTEAEKLDEEAERRGKERTIRERLWRLVGGNY
ncbi:hypothetical protein F5148DRAFT_387776 [Russula earlei]|uniref:Uncharacterized protein n=1 Tax=Russula earlei TaxID=71964 RepID=A0ACC0U1I3_9AGAM|nr:hypothetical protein F5148DRAFT_387776 [Russula earlei]